MNGYSLIANQAKHQPGKVALIEGERAFTYGELDRMAGQYAAELQRRGLRAGDRVRTSTPRSGGCSRSSTCRSTSTIVRIPPGRRSAGAASRFPDLASPSCIVTVSIRPGVSMWAMAPRTPDLRAAWGFSTVRQTRSSQPDPGVHFD